MLIGVQQTDGFVIENINDINVPSVHLTKRDFLRKWYKETTKTDGSRAVTS